MKLRFSCVAAAALVCPLAACSDEPNTSPGTAGASAIAGAGTGGHANAGAGTAGQTTGGGGTQGVAGSSGSGGNGGTSASGAGGVQGGTAGHGPSAGGTAGSGTGGMALPATFATVKALLMDTSTAYSCYGGLCHDFSENPYFQLKKDGVELTDDELHTMLLSYRTKNCGVAINTANPAESGLVKLLKAPCGGTERMPLGKCSEDGDEGCVPPAYIEAIQQWIAAGAMK